MQMYGNDLNPVAWFVVKNELAQVNPEEVKRLLDHVEAEVKPQIMPFYACDCPRGHKGKWTQVSTGKVMDESFDPLTLTSEERKDYTYEGPEIIYTFWAKHGPCQATECDHRTPIMSSPVIAVKTLTVKAWKDVECPKCGKVFDVEEQEARMAPAALFVVSPDETPYAIRDNAGDTECPHCGHILSKAMSGKSKNKSVDLTLLIHPDWLKGSPGHSPDGATYGGSVTDSAEATAAWNEERAKTLKLIEVRGPLPDEVKCPDAGASFYTDKRGGTVPKKSTFTCKEATCGKDQDALTSIKASGKSGPLAMYTVHGYCPTCNREGRPYSGRFFDVPEVRPFASACRERAAHNETDLYAFWPRSEVPYGFMTHHNNGGIANHGFTHWWTMFNPRQMLVLARLLKSIVQNNAAWDAREFILGGFQQFLRNENMFCIWDISRDCMAPHFSNNNYHPKANIIENSVFAVLGRGNWQSCAAAVLEGLDWCSSPWDSLPKSEIEGAAPELADRITGKSLRVSPDDPVRNGHQLSCRSSSDLTNLSDGSFDAVVTAVTRLPHDNLYWVPKI
jgi:putative DNA methylase